MNKYILIGILAIILIGGGVYLLSNSSIGNSTSDEHSMGNMDRQPIAQSHRSYEIEMTSRPTSIETKKSVTFRYKIKNDKEEVVKNYVIAHEKVMHFITVRKDLSYFQHLHPDYNEATGEFTVVVTFPDDGPYRLFPDFTPGDDNPQKLPVTVSYDVSVGDNYATIPVNVDTEPEKRIGSYRIIYNFPKEIKKQEELQYDLMILKDNKIVSNLEPYLGALGHSVILKEGSLDFIHTHALTESQQGQNDSIDEHTMTNMQQTGEQNANIYFATSFPESGVYKIFTQFQHEGKIQTVDYTIKVD